MKHDIKCLTRVKTLEREYFSCLFHNENGKDYAIFRSLMRDESLVIHINHVYMEAVFYVKHQDQYELLRREKDRIIKVLLENYNIDPSWKFTIVLKGGFIDTYEEFLMKDYCKTREADKSKKGLEMNKFWIVWNPGSNIPPSYQHTTFASAQLESERLARLHQGKQFFVCEIVGVSEQKISIYTSIDTPLPF